MGFRIALRSVFRNGRRTLLTLSVIAVGVAVLVVFAGFTDNMEETLREVTIKNQYGHLQLAQRGYWEDRSAGGLTRFLMDDYRAIRRDLEALPHVVRVAPSMEFMGLVGNGDVSLAFLGRGVEIDADTDPTRNFPRLAEGTVSGGVAPDAAFLGKGLVSGLKSKLHDNSVLLTTTKAGALNAIDVSIAGVMETGAREFDNSMVIVPLARAQALLDTPGALKLSVYLDSTANLDSVFPEVERYLAERHPEVEARPWSELAGFYRQVVNMNRAVFHFIGLIIAVIATFSIANTFLMSLFERVPEVGTVRAMGATRFRILGIFLLEGLVLGVIGAVAGAGLGVAAAKLISIKGISIPAMPGFSMGYSGRINVVLPAIVRAVSLGALTAVMASVYPALRAARLNIIEAIRHV
jgi:putative ABC transport system permease protein